MKKYPSRKMVEHFNLVLQLEGTCLRYEQDSVDGEMVTYKLVACDKYINNNHTTIVHVTTEFENKVRNFFKEYGVEHIGYTNTVATIFSSETI